MRDYLDKPTIKEQLEGYLESEDLEMDIDGLKNEYVCQGQQIPHEDCLCNEAVANMRKHLENLAVCKSEGHQLQETADPENGTSDLSCDRCGYHETLQW